jgi:mutator protein MutT
MVLMIDITIVIIYQHEKVLLGARGNVKDYSGYWSCPSGHIEHGESAEEAAKREIQEEVGIIISQLSPCHIIEEKKKFRFHFFLCDTWKGEPSNLESQYCNELRWFALDRLPDKLVPCCKQALNDFGLLSSAELSTK